MSNATAEPPGPGPERIAAVLDDEGAVLNVVVLPETDEQLGDGWRAQLPRVRVLTADERQRGVGLGWRRAGNGRWRDERPPPPSTPAPTDGGPPATVTPSHAGGSSAGDSSQGRGA